MNTNTKKPIGVRIMIIIIPICALLAAYFLLFNDSNASNTGELKDSSSVLIEPLAEDQKNGSKIEVYERESQNLDSKTKRIKNSSLDDMFDEVDGKNKKEVTPEIADAWELNEKEEPVIELEKPKKTYSTRTKKTVVEKVIVPKDERRKGFYSSSNNEEETSNNSNNYNSSSNNKQLVNTIGFIKATVQSEHHLKSGQTLKMRLLEDCVLGGYFIPKNTYVTGRAAVSTERVSIAITGIKTPNKIIPVKMVVFDYDGVEGIYIPGGVNQDIAKDAVSNGGVSVSTKIPIIGGTIQGGGSKKAQDPVVTIPVGYKLYVREKEF